MKKKTKAKRTQRSGGPTVRKRDEEGFNWGMGKSRDLRL